MKEAVPKQFLLLGGEPVIMHTIRQFATLCEQIIVALPEAYLFPFWEDLQKKHRFCVAHTPIAGGETRFESVKHALERVSAEGLVAIHDAVRPFASKHLIERCFDEAEQWGNAVASLPVAESLRMREGNGSKSVDRSRFYRIQTPQVFRCSEIKAAYSQAYCAHFTDDATVLEAQGGRIHLVEGEERNMKITTPTDRLLATEWIKIGNE